MPNVVLDKAIKKLLFEAEEAANLLSEVHDTHIWSEDDQHPKDGCGYCNGERSLRAAIDEVKKLEGIKKVARGS